MNQIIISGTTGVGKTLYAKGLVALAESGNLSIAISDHELFTDTSNYSKRLEKIKKLHSDKNVDISIIVVNNGNGKLQIEFCDRMTYELMELFFLHKKVNSQKNLERHQ